jgi:DNA-binding IclR family transcriptional regulator
MPRIARKRNAVLDYLRKWKSDTDSNIALSLDMPAPSVRRCIQELIHEGHNVTFASATGLYTLTFTQAPETSAPSTEVV